MDAKIEVLKRVPLFSGLSRRELTSLARLADELDVPAGRELTHEGLSGKEFIVLVDGIADVTRDGELINMLGPGDYLGEIAVLTGVPRTATVTTRTPSRLLVLHATALRSLFNEQRSVRRRLLESVGTRLAA